MTAPRVVSNADLISKIIQASDADPETSHSKVDAEVEQALRDLVALPSNKIAWDNARRAVALLDLEESEGWTRWYA